MLISTLPEPENNKIESFFRKIWPGSRKEEKPRVRLWERRHAFRLKLRRIRTIQVTLETEGGNTFKTILNDVSAGGFSCLAPFPGGLNAGDVIRVRMSLPQKPPLVIETEASFLGMNTSGDESGVGRFQFTQALAEEKRDEIHAYVMEIQLKAVQRMKPVPA